MPYDPDKPVRIHRKAPPPPWQRRSRWFPHIDAADALVLSAITLGVVVAYSVIMASLALGTLIRTADPVLRRCGVTGIENGYALTAESDQVPSQSETTEVGRFVWSVRTERRGYFGPFPVATRQRPAAWVFLDDGHTLTREQAWALIAAAPDAVKGYSLGRPTGIAEYEPSMVEFEFAEVPVSVWWSGIVLNTFMWLSLAVVWWSLSWFVFSARAFLDPRRKRAAKLAVNLCPRCDYDTRMIESKQCPECGEALVIEVGDDSP